MEATLVILFFPYTLRLVGMERLKVFFPLKLHI